ncbi:MAG TPA: PH domain-containing protein [Candidatus Woesebacteria bacterium]|nr:PH domain-containing protein [Candidatus Woesebacteria bacterium]
MNATNSPYEFYFIRKSPLILLSKLFLFEIIFFAVYILVRVPKLFLTEVIPVDILLDLNFWSFVVFSVFSFLQVIMAVLVTLQWTNEYYIIRSSEILHRRGTFTLKEETFSLNNVEAFTVEESFWGKLFHFGTVRFYSPVLKVEYSLEEVPDPLELKKTIERMVKQNRSQHQRGETIIPIRRR